jgi:hypothetical protein
MRRSLPFFVVMLASVPAAAQEQPSSKDEPTQTQTQTPAPEPPKVEPAPRAPAATSQNVEIGKMGIGIPMLRYANTWDVNLEGGVGSVFRDADRLAWLARARVGGLFVRDNNFWQVGATAEWVSALGRPAFGVQGEYLHLELGTWFQLGGSIDTKGKPGGMIAGGLSIVGVEAQYREFENDTEGHVALLAKLRIPIGVLAYGLRSKKD